MEESWFRFNQPKTALLVIQSDPFGMVIRDLQRSGMKLGHGLNHLAEVF